jgi:hypothetical protein
MAISRAAAGDTGGSAFKSDEFTNDLLRWL